MAYLQLLTDRCDIYHLITQPNNGKWGLPTEQLHVYAETPDIENMACLFVKAGQTAQVNQEQPNAVINEMFLVHFPISADIRINDKVIWDGATYRMKKPRKIRNHHQEVEVYRSDSL